MKTKPFLESLVEKSEAVTEANKNYIGAVARFNSNESGITAGDVDFFQDILVDRANDLIAFCHIK